MIAYTNKDLHNKQVLEESSEAFRHQYIGADTYKKIMAAHPSELYTPHLFIRIGLCILTIVIITFSGTLLAILFSSFDSLNAFSILMALVCYGGLELMVKQKKYYNAGIDNILQLATLGFLMGGMAFEIYPNHYQWMAFILFLASAWMAWRFSDAFMGILAYVNLFGFVFLAITLFGDMAKAFAPLVMMFFSAIIFLLVKKIASKFFARFHQKVTNAISVCTLITFYACGNYFVVKELSNLMFDLRLALTDPIPMGWLFWIFTTIIPIAYITYGIVKKDRLFLRTGLVLIAVTVLTIRYYHEILAVEQLMLLAGIILTALSYITIKYLHTPKNGFTFEDTGSTNKGLLQLESLIIAETFGQKAASQNQSQVEFGGGSGGGGGAGGTF